MSSQTLSYPGRVLERGSGGPAAAVGQRSRPLAVKVAVDRVLATALLIGLGPALALILAVVRLTSRGPAIYRQTRLGLGGRPFTLYKVRSMRHDCEKGTGPTWSTGADPRVTPLGRFLRASHLDELPQLWNVLRGEMSLVGPRPERPEFVAQLEKALPDYRRRLLVRPGLTGLAQVQLPPDVDLEDVRRKLDCDLHYVESIGPWLDLRIMLGTALRIVGVPFRAFGPALWLPSQQQIRRRSAATSPRGADGGPSA
jgi:lipopolysaccharide/colanic/teichoic acid biosynthesis glycosyltransferase